MARIMAFFINGLSLILNMTSSVFEKLQFFLFNPNISLGTK